MHLIWPWQDRSGRFSLLKASTLLLMTLPCIRLIQQFSAGDFGILPIAFGGLTYTVTGGNRPPFAGLIRFGRHGYLPMRNIPQIKSSMPATCPRPLRQARRRASG